MLLVAKKPSYKTMYTLKFAAGLKAFTVSLDSWSLVWRFVAELVGLFDCLRLQGYKTMGDDTGNLHANRCQKIPTV